MLFIQGCQDGCARLQTQRWDKVNGKTIQLPNTVSAELLLLVFVYIFALGDLPYNIKCISRYPFSRYPFKKHIKAYHNDTKPPLSAIAEIMQLFSMLKGLSYVSCMKTHQHINCCLRLITGSGLRGLFGFYCVPCCLPASA